MADSISFGSRLREARIKAGFKTMALFADHLSNRDLPYSDEAIGNWENNRRVPNRPTLLQILQILADTKGLTSIREVNEMLWLCDMRDVNHTEIHAHFSTLTQVGSPMNLPRQPFEQLVGRNEIVTTVVNHLADAHSKSVIILSGLGGIGKTAIAYEVARRSLMLGNFEKLAWESVKSEEFEGVTIRKRSGQQISLTSVLTSYARQLGYEGLAGLPLETLKERLREILRSENVLLVFDNIETTEAAVEITRVLHELVTPSVGQHPSKILITSRERLVDIPYVLDKFIQGLSEEDANELLRQEATSRDAESLLTQGENIIGRVYEVTQGMPLAIKLVVSQYLLGIRIEDELQRLKKAINEEELYSFIYERLWEKLSIPSQQVIVGAATFPTSARRPMLMRVARLAEEEFNRSIAELVRASLIEAIHLPDTDQRFDIHAMTRWFVNAPLTEKWNRQKGKSS